MIKNTTTNQLGRILIPANDLHQVIGLAGAIILVHFHAFNTLAPGRS